MKINTRFVPFATILFSAILVFASCKKDEVRQKGEKVLTYENTKHIFDSLDNAFRKQSQQASTKAQFYNTPTWSDGIHPIPSISPFYYCGNTASPLGPGFVRFHYQIDVNTDIIKSIRFGNRLELRFFSSAYGTTNNDSKVYLSGGGSSMWPQCVYIDRPVSEMVIPNYMVASLVPSTGSSTYTLTLTGPYGDPGWNGIINFPSPPTLSISKGNYITPHPSGYGVCP